MPLNSMIYSELIELNSTLASFSNKNVFAVPEGYFDTLPVAILEGIHNEYPIINMEIPAVHGQVPMGYFEGLAEEIMHKIKQEEEDTGLLKKIGKGNIFSVPEGYFDQLAGNIMNRLRLEQARVIEMKPRPSIVKYVAAACIAGFIGLSVFSVLDNKKVVEPVAQMNVFEEAREILATNSFDKVMESLGDDEIVGYLENNGADVNAVLVASLIDDKSLPELEAYYMDEKTLDNFLIEKNISTPVGN